MKFQVNRDVFSEAVSFAVKLLPQRTTLPILSGVLIETTDSLVVRLRGVSADTDRGRGRRARSHPGVGSPPGRHREPPAQRPGGVLHG